MLLLFSNDSFFYTYLSSGLTDQTLSRAMKFQGHGDLLGWIYDLTDNIQLEEELEMQVLINALTESYWNMYL